MPLPCSVNPAGGLPHAPHHADQEYPGAPPRGNDPQTSEYTGSGLNVNGSRDGVPNRYITHRSAANDRNYPILPTKAVGSPTCPKDCDEPRHDSETAVCDKRVYSTGLARCTDPCRKRFRRSRNRGVVATESVIDVATSCENTLGKVRNSEYSLPWITTRPSRAPTRDSQAVLNKPQEHHSPKFAIGERNT